MSKLCRNCENAMDFGHYKTLSGKNYNYKCSFCNWFDSDEVFNSLCTLVNTLETQIKYLTVRIDVLEYKLISPSKTLSHNNLLAHDSSFSKTNITKVFNKENHECRGDDVVSIISGKSNHSGPRYGTPTNSSLFRNRKK